VEAGGAGKLAELGHLVLPERLGGEEQEGSRGRIVGDCLEDRDGVAERLARRRRRDDDDVAAESRGLMAPPW
jgi:hypothetical protein